MSLTNWIFDGYLILILSVLTLMIIYINTSLNYWKRRNIHCVKVPRFNLSRAKVYNDEDYRYFKKIGEKVYGIYIYLSPILILIDPDVIKNVMGKDFHVFNGRGTYVNPEKDPLSNNLLFMQGKAWKNMRVKLTPAFTSAKIKLMFDEVLRCSNILTDGITKNLIDIDIKENLSCFATDVIGSCAFGIEINSLCEPNVQFRYYGRKAVDFLVSTVTKRLFLNTFPTFGTTCGMSMQNDDIWEFFYGFVNKSIEFRDKNNYRRNDFLQALIDMKNSPNEEEHLTVREITAQCYIFFLAGFETTSSTLTFALYEMAKNKDIQDKVRKEINEVLTIYDGNITYDSLKEMKYLNQVLNETLRKYPVTHTLKKQCRSDYVIPNTNMVVEKGTVVIIPLVSLHRDEEYYPEPDKFDPERFNDFNKGLIPPNVYMPFGYGPRICIGLRFAIVQTTTALVNLLRNYEISISEKTKPILFDPHNFTLTSTDKIYLNAKTIIKR